MEILPDNIYLGDAVALLRDMPDKSVDAIITDPPYKCDKGGGAETADFADRVPKRRISHLISGFDYDTCFAEFLRVCRIPNFLIFCSNKQITTVMGYFERIRGLSVTLLVWHKTNPIPLANQQHVQDLEFIVYVRGKGATFNADLPLSLKTKCFTSPITKTLERQEHPTQKLLSHIRRYVLLHTKKGDVILDPFMGAAATCVAALLEKRRYIGFEIDENYYRIAKRRIAAVSVQQSFFECIDGQDS